MLITAFELSSEKEKPYFTNGNLDVSFERYTNPEF